MTPLRRATRRASSLALLATVGLFAACTDALPSGGSGVQPAAIKPDACSLLSAAQVAAALLPAPAAPTPTPATSPSATATATAATSPTATASAAQPTASTSAAAPPSPRYSVRPITAGKAAVTAGQCTYSSPQGPTLVVSVLPKTVPGSLVTGAAPGAFSLGGALAETSAAASALSFAKGADTIILVLGLSSVDPIVRVNRLVALANAIGGGGIPTAAPTPAGGAGGTAINLPTPPPPPGEVVSGQSAAEQIDMVDAQLFQPSSANLKVGDVVQWTDVGTKLHDVTFDQAPALTSGTINPGGTYEIKFTVAGSYPYRCTIHPGMNGSLTVTA